MKPFYLLSAIIVAVLLSGCQGIQFPLASTLKAGSSAAFGYAAYAIAPDDWKTSEKVALGAATAAATWIVGELVDAKIDKDKLYAFDSGFSAGRAVGARRQYEIIQSYQRSNLNAGRIKTISLPAPGIPGVNQVGHNVFLEVLE